MPGGTGKAYPSQDLLHWPAKELHTVLCPFPLFDKTHAVAIMHASAQLSCSCIHLQQSGNPDERMCLQSQDGSKTASDKTETWKNGDSWYFDQQTWLSTQCNAQPQRLSVQEWTWTAWRPPAIIGFAPGAPVSNPRQHCLPPSPKCCRLQP